MNFVIIDDFGKEHKVFPKVRLYKVKDFMGNELPGLAIVLNEKHEGYIEPYATLTVSFGEFISIKNAAYVDTNNCPFAEVLIQRESIGEKTTLTKRSGFCEYPLYVFNEGFLAIIGGLEYQKYVNEFDRYMKDFQNLG